MTVYLNLILCNYMQNWYNCDIKNIGSYLGGGGSRGAQNMHMNVHTNPNTTGSYKQ